MILTQDRADILSGILATDTELTKKLLMMDPEEALIQINALGNDFVLEELDEYSIVLKGALAEQGELDADALDDVAGGFGPLIIGGVAVTKAVVGAVVGSGVLAGAVAFIGSKW